MTTAHVYPASKPLNGIVDPPSSKNFTTRYILASCLADGKSIVHRPAVQDDAVALVHCARRIGATIVALDAKGREIEYEVENGEVVDRLEIHGFGAKPTLSDPTTPIKPGNAGAVFRMLLAISALLPEVRWDTDYKDSLGKRPNLDLIEALQQIGVEIEYTGDDGRLPITMRGGIDRITAALNQRRTALSIPPQDPVPITVSGAVSSQFTSALLFLAPLLNQTVEIHATGLLKSIPLIETTRNVLTTAGIEIESSDARHIHLIRAGQKYKTQRWETNGDWPGSAAILAAAAVIPGSTIAIRRLFEDDQGEKESAAFYQLMGCTAHYEDDPKLGRLMRFETPANTTLKAAGVNGDLCTDAVLAMMGAAMLADGRSRFVDIRNLQFKECDRVREPLAELQKIWETVLPSQDPNWRNLPPEKALYFEPQDDPDTIHITGAPQGYQGGIEVDGRGDHRVIMLLSIIALRCQKGLKIKGAEHVAKSFPTWFDTLRQMGARIDLS